LSPVIGKNIELAHFWIGVRTEFPRNEPPRFPQCPHDRAVEVGVQDLFKKPVCFKAVIDGLQSHRIKGKCQVLFGTGQQLQHRSRPYLSTFVLVEESRTESSRNQNHGRRARLFHTGGIEPTQIRRRVTVTCDSRPGEHYRAKTSRRDHHVVEDSRYITAHRRTSHSMRGALRSASQMLFATPASSDAQRRNTPLADWITDAVPVVPYPIGQLRCQSVACHLLRGAKPHADPRRYRLARVSRNP